MPISDAWLQRGRALVSAEMDARQVHRPHAFPLQRGRALVSAEIGWELRGLVGNQPASTGPRFGKRGDFNVPLLALRTSQSFNGAALW